MVGAAIKRQEAVVKAAAVAAAAAAGGGGVGSTWLGVRAWNTRTTYNQHINPNPYIQSGFILNDYL